MGTLLERLEGLRVFADEDEEVKARMETLADQEHATAMAKHTDAKKGLPSLDLGERQKSVYSRYMNRMNSHLRAFQGRANGSRLSLGLFFSS